MELMEALLHDRQLGLVPRSAGIMADLELYIADFVQVKPKMDDGAVNGWERALVG